MKLLHRTTRDFLLATIIILVIAGIGLYKVLQEEVTNEMNEQLILQTALVNEQMITGTLPAFPYAHITPTTDPVETPPVYGDTVILDLVQLEEENYHYLDIVKNIGGKNYHVKVMTAYVGWHEYYKTIFYILLAALILVAAAGALINYLSNKNIWKPFFQNLENLKKYTVSSPEPLQLHDSSITEFKELQRTLKDLTDRSHREYTALREFTENASHEIQTPVGIIQSKLDRLSQLEVSEEMAKYIVQARSGVERLNKMNKNLLLLAKLDNHTFEGKQQVAFHEVLRLHLEMMEDLFTAKNISLCSHIDQAVVILDPYLCEVLVSNLFSNALRYTEQGGAVTISLRASQLIITNTGEPLDFPPGRLFDRFRKSAKNVQSNGLGLAIVRQICLLNGWEIHYGYYDGKHAFTLSY
jgi:signal transduction histidine kinase